MSEFLTSVLHPERARATGRPGWVSIVGLVLVPLLIGGLMVWALWKPDERLDRIPAAVVNEDQPVQVDGQTVPLGRQLAAGLVTSSASSVSSSTASPAATSAAASGTASAQASTSPALSSGDSTAAPTPAATTATTGGTGDATNVSGHDSGTNFTWVVTSAADAAQGLADGSYATVVTIPAGFSAAATSTGTDAAHARQATIDIATSDRSRPVDAAVAQVVTSTAVRVLSNQLTTTYLQNVLVGFDTLHGSLQDASTGASKLASGASSLSSGASSVSSGASSLASGAGQVASGASSVASGASSLASGASSLSSGTGQVSSGAQAVAAGLDQLAAKTSSAAATAKAGVAGAQAFAAGLDQLNAAVNKGAGGQPPLTTATSQLAAGAAGLQTGLSGFGQQASGYAQACAAGSTAACDALVQLVDATAQPNTPSSTVAPNLAYLVGVAGNVKDGAAGLDSAVNTGSAGTPALKDAVSQLAANGDTLAAGVSSSASGLQQITGAVQQAASGAHQVADGAQQASAGASSLADGASSLSGGATSLASGAQQSSAGASSLASGASQLASGASSLGTGASSLADGLGTAAGKVPSYSTDQASRLAQVVADPVATSGSGTTGLFGGASIPFVLVVALWLGALASFVVLGATAPRVVGSTRSSLRLALTSFVPGAAIGAVQGLALTAVMAGALDLTPGRWVAFGAVSVLAGVVFAAVNQGLVAAFRGTGRFLSVVVAVVGLATAVVSTVPGLLDDLAGALPIAPARTAMQAVVNGDGIAGPLVLLVVWGVVGLALTTASVARRRVVPAGRLARWTRAA